ncbi:hypothetical protein ACFUCH_37375, partial [Streptomyces olivaceus]
GIDVRRSFTLVFAIGGAAAGLGGVLASVYYGYVSAHLGSVLLIFAFIVTVIGGLGSLTGRRRRRALGMADRSRCLTPRSPAGLPLAGLLPALQVTPAPPGFWTFWTPPSRVRVRA